MTQLYTFGETDIATQRLELLAEAFEPSSRAFITRAANRNITMSARNHDTAISVRDCDTTTAADLGCGPGHTTHLLSNATSCSSVIGFDKSPHYISHAKQTTDNICFQRHDVRTTPLPFSPFDVIYARFLLTHQRNISALLARWITQLQPGGRLLLEETDQIRTNNTVFAEYIQIVDEMLADKDYDLYVGRKLDMMPIPSGATLCVNKVIRVELPTDTVARLFHMNMQTWQHNAFIRENFLPTSIWRLEEQLTELAAIPTNDAPVEWGIRQLVFERKA